MILLHLVLLALYGYAAWALWPAPSAPASATPGNAPPPPHPIASWTPQRSLADMDRAGIAQAVLSMTTPGLYLPGAGVEAVGELLAGPVAARTGRPTGRAR